MPLCLLLWGGNDFPTFDDRPRLPFVDPTCKEVTTRWQPVVLLEDGVNEGSFIPKSEFFFSANLLPIDGRSAGNRKYQAFVVRVQRPSHTVHYPSSGTKPTACSHPKISPCSVTSRDNRAEELIGADTMILAPSVVIVAANRVVNLGNDGNQGVLNAIERGSPANKQGPNFDLNSHDLFWQVHAVTTLESRSRAAMQILHSRLLSERAVYAALGMAFEVEPRPGHGTANAHELAGVITRDSKWSLNAAVGGDQSQSYLRSMREFPPKVDGSF
ncbi:hypothetical protein EDB87DRAFT_1818749 [Lactarius vividus]|nr:hypothetical protein EDB87DRAFT_1818749 [Lactarius vividus]